MAASGRRGGLKKNKKSAWTPPRHSRPIARQEANADEAVRMVLEGDREAARREEQGLQGSSILRNSMHGEGARGREEGAQEGEKGFGGQMIYSSAKTLSRKFNDPLCCPHVSHHVTAGA
jgi:hypothetical protein